MSARGNDRRTIFHDDQARRHFLEHLAELPERFATRLHGWVLMDNHYHLLVETPEPNLSQTGQWLNVSYSVWFNRRHGRSGHLFQGRFSAVLVGGEAYTAVAQAVRRVRQGIHRDKPWRRRIDAVNRQLS